MLSFWGCSELLLLYFSHFSYFWTDRALFFQFIANLMIGETERKILASENLQESPNQQRDQLTNHDSVG